MAQNSQSSPLSEQLAEKAAAYAKRAPAERLAAGRRGIEMVRATGIEKSAKQVGALHGTDRTVIER